MQKKTKNEKQFESGTIPARESRWDGSRILEPNK